MTQLIDTEETEDALVEQSRCPLETRYGMGVTILRCGRPAHAGQVWCLDHLVEHGYADTTGRTLRD